MDPGGAKNLSSPKAELFLSHGGADSLILQARMAYHCEDDTHISGSWQYVLNRLMSLHFDSENGHWRVDHPGGRWMKKWENDRAMTDFLKKVSMETVGPGLRLS